jgi:hypothetical protein
MTTDLNWSTTVIEEYAYLYLPDESSCRSLHSLCLLIDGDLLVADVMVSTFMADVYMLTPILWVPLDFLDDVVISLRCLLSTGLLLPLAQLVVDDVAAAFPLATASGRPPCVELVVAVVCSGTL